LCIRDNLSYLKLLNPVRGFQNDATDNHRSRTMSLILRLNLYVLGVGAVGIGTSMFLLGAETTALFFASLNAALWSQPDEIADLSTPNVDSELRFYAVFWVTYGVFVVRTAHNLSKHLQLVPLLAGLFFAGGIGRLLSLLLIGEPHPLFVRLMIVELILPLFLIWMWAGVNRQR
jgi:hypothetical protein